MGAQKGKKEKYPARNKWLPLGFNNRNTHNKVLQDSNLPESMEGSIVINSKGIGLNKKSVKTSTKIPWGEIYVISAVKTNLYKIGCSGNFKRRYRDLCAASPLPLGIVHYAVCDNPHLLEAHLHELLKSKYFKNEWFALDDYDLELIETVFNRYFDAD